MAHPRWGFDNLPRDGLKGPAGKSLSQRKSEWVNDEVRGWKKVSVPRGGEASSADQAAGADAWDGSAFKQNLIDTLHNRLLMKVRECEERSDEARRKEGGVYGVRNLKRVGISDVTYGSNGIARR